MEKNLFQFKKFFFYNKMEKNLFQLKKFFSYNKMENYKQMKVSTLKNLSRERGLHGYSRLRKSELIEQIKKTSSARIHENPVKTTGKRERFTRIL